MICRGLFCYLHVMKAKCPYCNTGCLKCEEGYIQVGLAQGVWYTMKCADPKCGFENGVYILEEGKTLPEFNKWTRNCVQCKSPVVWKELG